MLNASLSDLIYHQLIAFSQTFAYRITNATFPGCAKMIRLVLKMIHTFMEETHIY